MASILSKIKSKTSGLWRFADGIARSKAVGALDYEVAELENIFALLVLGAFVGLPSPPIQITLDLMPEMADGFSLMLSKVATAHDPLGELFSVLEID